MGENKSANIAVKWAIKRQKRKVRKGYLKVSQFLAYGTTLIADTSGKINSLERFARGDY